MRHVIVGLVTLLVFTAIVTAEDSSKAQKRPPLCGGDCPSGKHEGPAGQCASCEQPTPAKNCRLCAECANASDLCMECGFEVFSTGESKVVVGELNLVDKQPDKDFTYYVLIGEDGSKQGVSIDPRRPLSAKPEGRLLVRYVENRRTQQFMVREVFALEGSAHDHTLKKRQAVKLGWQVRGITKWAEPVDNFVSLTLPAIVGRDIQIITEEADVLETWRFDGSSWTKK